MKERQTAIVVALFALAVALLLKLYIRHVETNSTLSKEHLELQDFDKTRPSTRTQFVPIARGSAKGGSHLLSALNDRDIGGMMQGNRTVIVYVQITEKAEAVRVLDMLGRKDLWSIQENSLTPR